MITKNEKESLIPKHGGYRKLKSFQISQLVYDVTVQFCDRYIERRSRTHDQMVQAARSGVQNIAEGSMASGTSKKTELKLTNVARASLEELRLDYEDYLRQRDLPEFKPEHPALKRFKERQCASLNAVRIWVAEEVKRRLLPNLPVDVDCFSLGGISLMEHLIDYERAVLIDAFPLEESVGSILMLRLNDLPNYSAFHTTNARDISLRTAIKMGKAMGAQLPDDVTVVGITTERPHIFSRELSTPVAAAVPQAVKFVLDLLGEKMQMYGR